MCKSKFRGGMGFRKLQAFNLAMLAKQGWRLVLNPDSLVARIYKAKYYQHGDVFKAKLVSNPSYAWRSIMNGLEMVKRVTRWRVGNGNLIHIWEDKWLPIPSTYKVIPPPPPKKKQFGDFPMVSALIDKDTRSWKVELIRSLFLPFKAITILNMPLSHKLPEDKIIWVGNRKGDFTVKSAYYIALSVVETKDEGECSDGDSRVSLWKKIWHLNISEKIKIFAWRACVNGLPTKVNLQTRGINVGVLCPGCDGVLETISHALIDCRVAKRVWDCWKDCPVNLVSNHWDVSDSALEIIMAGTSTDLETFFVAAWAIWYKSIRSSRCKYYVILPHQKPTLLFYHIILQYLIYQMFYIFITSFKYYILMIILSFLYYLFQW